MKGDDFGWVNTIQYTDDVLWNCTPESYIILLTNEFTSLAATTFPNYLTSQ